MKSLGSILDRIDRSKDPYVSREFQSFGLYIANELCDSLHKSLYIKMAKEYPRDLLEQALSFVKDAHARNKGALFMWKLKELRKVTH